MRLHRVLRRDIVAVVSAEELNALGMPLVIVNSSERTRSHPTDWAPAERRNRDNDTPANARESQLWRIAPHRSSNRRVPRIPAWNTSTTGAPNSEVEGPRAAD